MWQIFIALLMVAQGFYTTAPTNVAAVQYEQTTYTVTVSNLMNDEKRFLVEFTPFESGAAVERPEGLDCLESERGTYFLACKISIAAGSTGKVTFPVTWRIEGERQFRIVVFVETPDDGITDAIFAEYRTVTVEQGFHVAAPTNVTAVQGEQTPYTVTISNLHSDELEFIVEFEPGQSGADIEAPPADEDMYCGLTRRHIYNTFCVVRIGPHDTKEVTFPVTWTIEGTQTSSKVEVIAETPGIPWPTIFEEYLTVNVQPGRNETTP